MILKGLISRWWTIYFYFALSLRKIIFWRSRLKAHGVYVAPPFSLVLYFNVCILSLILNYHLQFVYNYHCSFVWFCGLPPPLVPLTPFSLRASKWLPGKYFTSLWWLLIQAFRSNSVCFRTPTFVSLSLWSCYCLCHCFHVPRN